MFVLRADLPIDVMTVRHHVFDRHRRIGCNHGDPVRRVQKLCGGKAQTGDQRRLSETPKALFDRILHGVFRRLATRTVRVQFVQKLRL